MGYFSNRSVDYEYKIKGNDSPIISRFLRKLLNVSCCCSYNVICMDSKIAEIGRSSIEVYSKYSKFILNNFLILIT